MRILMTLATLLVAGLASPASALDVGLGGSGGGIGADASLGNGGASVGAGASLGGGSLGAGGGASVGAGGVQARGSAALGGRGTGASGGGVGTNGGVTAVGNGAQAGAGAAGRGSATAAGAGPLGLGDAGAPGSAGGASVANGGRSASRRSVEIGSTASLGRPLPFGRTATAADPAIPLPGRLLPVGEAQEPGSPGLGARPPRPAVRMRPAYRPILSACRAALAEAAAAYGATKVDVAVTGSPRRSSDGGLSAPVQARIVYSRPGRVQIRQARVTCQFDATGQVVAAL